MQGVLRQLRKFTVTVKLIGTHLLTLQRIQQALSVLKPDQI